MAVLSEPDDAPRHRKCPRHDLYEDDAPCDPHCLNPARYYEALREGGE